jgi:hypothetical protein
MKNIENEAEALAHCEDCEKTAPQMCDYHRADLNQDARWELEDAVRRALAILDTLPLMATDGARDACAARVRETLADGLEGVTAILTPEERPAPHRCGYSPKLAA